MAPLAAPTARAGPRDAEPPRLLAVAPRLAVRDLGEPQPCAPLEVRALQLERQVERPSRAGEVLPELLCRRREHAFVPARGGLARPEDPAQPALRGDESERADRRVDVHVNRLHV